MTTQSPATTNNLPASPPTSPRASFMDIAANALRYWETRRLFYNLALSAVVVGHVISGWPTSWAMVTRDTVLEVFILAVLANVCYCAAYPVDLFVQFSAVRSAWPRWRCLLLGIGTAFAAAMTHFSASFMFMPGRPD